MLLPPLQSSFQQRALPAHTLMCLWLSIQTGGPGSYHSSVLDVTRASSPPATCLWSGPWSRRMSPWASWWGGWSGSAPGSRWPPPCSCSLEMERSSLYHHNNMIISPHPAPPWWPRSPCPCQSQRSSRSCCWDHMGSSPIAILLD